MNARRYAYGLLPLLAALLALTFFVTQDRSPVEAQLVDPTSPVGKWPTSTELYAFDRNGSGTTIPSNLKSFSWLPGSAR